MNGRTGTMSPISVDGSDWSGINQYQATSNKSSEPPFSPPFSPRANLATPPTSGGSGLPVPNNQIGLRRPTDQGNPSPPNSVAARSSVGTLGDQKQQQQQQRGRQHPQMEEILSQHYTVLKRFLQGPYRDDRGNPKSTKARDKLLRLSPPQFHELSTDVYDELLRRQQAMPGPNQPPRPDVPPFLPPREDFHEKRNQARQKLASLQHQRFRDLATDVFCELERRFPHFAARDVSRRGSPTPSMRSTTSRGRPPMNGYGPRPGPGGPPNARRSQSRGPPPGRMGRGYPSGGPPPGTFPPRHGSLGGMSPGGPNGEPLPKSFQSNTIVPNKSTLVEDDDDAGGVDSDYDARSDAFGLDAILQSRRGTTATLGDMDRRMLAETQSQISTLQDKIEKLEELLKTKEEEVSRLQEERDKHKSGSSEWGELKLDLEAKLSQAEDLNSSLQQELDSARNERQDMERDLRRQLDEMTRSSGGGAGADNTEWQARYQNLEEELHEQQKVTDEVRREAATFLMEMKVLSEQSQSNWEREERLSNQVQRLEEEVKEWKSRYAKAKTQLRQVRTSSVGVSGAVPDASAQIKTQSELVQPNGAIKDVHVTYFQMSIDELLRAARFEESASVLDHIKAVVLAVRHILQDVEVAAAQSADGGDMGPRSTKAKGRVSATANNLITASRNFAYASGLSPVSLLDAAASHLSMSVVELVRLAKIRPTPTAELHDAAADHDEDQDASLIQMHSPDYFSVDPSNGRFSNNESVYSAISTPPEDFRRETTAGFEHVANGMEMTTRVSYGMLPEEQEIRELKIYLEDQTDGLVHSIQDLVGSIRGAETVSTVRRHVSTISSYVTNVLTSTEQSVTKLGNASIQQRCGMIMQTIDNCRDRLVETVAEDEGDGDLRETTGKLPPIAFEIARQTKELIQCLDRLNRNAGEQEEEENDDFN